MLGRFPDPKPGDFIEAEWFTALYRALDEGVRVVAPLVKDHGGAISLQDQPGFWVQFTGAPSGVRHPWKEVFPQPGGTWMDGSATGTTTLDSAYEINGNATNLDTKRARAWRDRTSNEVRFAYSVCT